MKAHPVFMNKLSSLFRSFKYSSLSQYETEKAEQIFYIQYLQPGMVAFDVGANIGELSLLFSRFVTPQGQVHSFECSPNTFRRLSEIVTMSNRTNISTNCVCLSDVIGTANLHIFDDNHSSWNTLANRPLQQYGINVKPICSKNVPTTTIDAYCETHNIQQIDLLKVDVEGAEYQVLKGAHRMMREQRIRCVIFEFGQTTYDMGNDPSKLAQLISSSGYKLRNLIKGAPVFPGGESAATAQFSMHICTPSRCQSNN
jgi:FkbM family methyltransferase